MVRRPEGALKIFLEHSLDFIHEEDPASPRLRDTPWRKYFRFDAKSDYLVLRKSLPRLQENTLVVELVFPVGSKNASGNRKVLVARLELFIDKNANNFAKKVRRFRRRPQKTAPRFSSAQLIAKVRENRPVGTSVIMIQAQDTNNGYTGKIKYSMEASQNLLSLLFFGIDPNTGLIKTSASLDREKMPTHYLRIKAEYE